MLIQNTVYDQVKNQSMAVAEGANLPKADWINCSREQASMSEF